MTSVGDDPATVAALIVDLPQLTDAVVAMLCAGAGRG